MSEMSNILGDPGSEAKYIKRKKLGSGSYGEAWLVERPADGGVFVAKSMDLGKMTPRDKSYAYSEIKCLASCNHPNIIQYIEDHEENEHLLIVMELADSGDLDRQIKNRANDGFRYFKEQEALFLFIQLCLSVNHIHSHSMLHRDVKAANILLTSSGLIKLGDFGFSHQYDDTVSGVVAQTFCGTPYYLAPELWNNQRYSKKADVWAVGIILYEILALKKPFDTNNMRGLMLKINSGEYDPLPEHFSSDLQNVVRTILTCDPNARPSINDIFRIPYITEGLKGFLKSVNDNGRIAQATKDALITHVKEILSNTFQSTTEPAQHPVGQINMEITYKGFVKKLKNTGKSHSWKKRFLQIQQGHLVMSENENDEEGKVLNLDQVQSVCPVPASTARRPYVFAFNTINGNSMWFETVSKENMEEWIDAFHRAIGVT